MLHPIIFLLQLGQILLAGTNYLLELVRLDLIDSHIHGAILWYMLIEFAFHKLGIAAPFTRVVVFLSLSRVDTGSDE